MCPRQVYATRIFFEKWGIREWAVVHQVLETLEKSEGRQVLLEQLGPGEQPKMTHPAKAPEVKEC